jgi:plasmid stabilization system protein ParE
VPKTYHDEGGYKHDHPAQGDLNKGKVFWFDSESEERFENIPERIQHAEPSIERCGQKRAYLNARERDKTGPPTRCVSGKKINGEKTMPRGSKSKYTKKQKRKAEHIEEGYEKRGVGKKEAEKRAWATVNKSDKGGKKSGSGRGKKSSKSSSRKGGRKGGKKSSGRKKSR